MASHHSMPKETSLTSNMPDGFMPTHEMLLSNSADSDTETWDCTECDRSIRLTWPPNYARLVMVAGDDKAVHVGGKGGALITGTTVGPRSTRRGLVELGTTSVS